MSLPGVETWVEEGDVFVRLRIWYEHPTTFAKRAGDACQCEIFQRRTSAGDHWHRVIDVKGRFLSGLSKAAIFAMTFCPLDHLPAQDRRNGHRSVTLSVHSFRPHPEQREQFRQIDQAFGLMSLGVS